jgi:hypothetical protein
MDVNNASDVIDYKDKRQINVLPGTACSRH